MIEREYLIATQLAHVRDAESVLHGLIQAGAISLKDLNKIREGLRSVRLCWEAALRVTAEPAGEPNGEGP